MVSERTPILNGMTVDVEDYFQVSAFERTVHREEWDRYPRRVASNTDRLLDVLAEHGVQATFFVLGWVADHEPALVRRIAAAGHEIASHGYWHRLVYDQTHTEFRDDVRRSKALLEDLVCRPVLGYRAPSFSVTKRSLWALEVLAEEGFVYDASVFPIRHDRYGIPTAPRHPFWVATGTASRAAQDVVTGHRPGTCPPGPSGSALLEIPASTVRIAGMNLPIAGGGYFRILPFALTCWGVAHVNRVERQPVVFYLHPWEIDPGQPRLGVPARSRLRHYHNLSKTESRLRRLLTLFCFGTASAAFGVPISRC